jgi:hypothetical protein
VKRTLRRYLRPGPGAKRMPEPEPRRWRVLAPGYPTLPLVELRHDWRPTHWDTPEYRQDVPKG